MRRSLNSPEDDDWPDGLVYVEDFLGQSEERALIDALGHLPLQPFRMRGVTSLRQVAHYGWDYLYDAWKITPAAPIPGFLLPVRGRAADIAGVLPESLEEVLVTRYRPGAGIGWHRDAPMFGSPVVGLSLGSACILQFRRKTGERFQRANVALAPRSLYLIGGVARAQWQHTIAASPALRYSVTFRSGRKASRSANRTSGSRGGSTAGPSFCCGREC